MEIRRLSDSLIGEFGEKIYRIALNAGCTCPNRDGRLGTGGCTFCSGSGSGDFAPEPLPLELQIEEAKKRIEGKTHATRFIGYFQSFTNTYGDQERLMRLFRESISRPDIAALSIATRPDCLEPEMVSFLSELNRQKPANIGQAARISGVSPADIQVLLIYCKRGFQEGTAEKE